MTWQPGRQWPQQIALGRKPLLCLLGGLCSCLFWIVACQPITPAGAHGLKPPLNIRMMPPMAPDSGSGRDSVEALTIARLRQRTYGSEILQVEQTLSVSPAFTRTLIYYNSDGLRVYAFMNTPPGDGPFPVVIVNHGYIDPSVYSTLTYTTRYADALARAGYIAIHPNFRNYPPSDPGPNQFRTGYAIDVLNLVALVREVGGRPGPLATADPETIGLWGHSMGGGVSLRAVTVDPDIDAAILYGAMSGDEARNHTRILYFSGGARGLWSEDERLADSELRRISPIYHLDNIETPISLHHGTLDDQVPPAWSAELCTLLQELGKTVECYQYLDMPHTFWGDGDEQFIARMIKFYDRYLKVSP